MYFFDGVNQVRQTFECIVCLLYTSDAADEGLGVDLGGRRIIKKLQPISVGVGRRLPSSFRTRLRP